MSLVSSRCQGSLQNLLISLKDLIVPQYINILFVQLMILSPEIKPQEKEDAVTLASVCKTVMAYSDF